MEFELRRAQERLAREQRQRKEAASARIERERRAKAEDQRRRSATEAAQRSKRIEAKLQEEQALQDDLVVDRGIIFSRKLEAILYEGQGDKIKLPPSCFKELSNLGALDRGTMYFRVSRVHDDRVLDADHTMDKACQVTHSGVLEFTAVEGSVELTPHVWCNLFTDDNWYLPLVEVCYVSLPKGTYVKLQPEGPGFFDIPLVEAVLKTTLRNHATTSQGDVLSVKYGSIPYKVKVLELKPASAVSVLETDIEVDIAPAISETNLANGMDEHVLTPLVLGKPETGIVDEGKFKYYKFVIDHHMNQKCANADMFIAVMIEADNTTDGDTNIYVSRHPLLFPTQHHHEWSSHEMGSKNLVLNLKDRSSEPCTYSIGIFGFKGPAKYKVTVLLKENMPSQLVSGYSEAMPQDGTNFELCRNCKHYIAANNMVLHEAHCIRHNVLCQHVGCGVVLSKHDLGNHVHCSKCGRAFQQAEIAKHMNVFHEPLHCPCGVTLEKEEMAVHQSSSCPLRLIMCRFCGDMVQAGSTPLDARDRLRGLTEHESVCGCRTAPCDSCGRSVMLKDMEIHITAAHYKELKPSG